MLKDFDNAFAHKIKAWFSNTIYANTAIVYNVAYNLVDDPSVELRFPLISIYRPTGFELRPNQNFAAKRQGIEYYYNETTDQAGLARFLTVLLPYQLDIYARSPEDLDDITENIMQALNFDPILEVKQIDDMTTYNEDVTVDGVTETVTSNAEYVERYDIVYSNGPSEQSEFQNDDRIYHYSIVYEIPNARLVNFKTHKTIETSSVTAEVDNEEI